MPRAGHHRSRSRTPPREARQDGHNSLLGKFVAFSMNVSMAVGVAVAKPFVDERSGQILEATKQCVQAAIQGGSDQLGQELVNKANQLKGFLRKFMQQMGSRTDWIRDEGCLVVQRHLKSLLENCAPAMEAIEPLFHRLHTPNLTFVEVRKAGSIGAVSLVKDCRGKEFAFKTVDQQSIEAYEADFELLRSGMLVPRIRDMVSTMTRGLPVNRLGSLGMGFVVDLANFINNMLPAYGSEDFINPIRQEANLRAEAQNLRDWKQILQVWDTRLSGGFSGLVRLGVPDVVEELEDGTGMLTHWVQGVSLKEFVQDGAVPLAQDMRLFFRILLRIYLYSLVVFGRLHGDLHPGNLMVVSTDGRWMFYLIDFGYELHVAEKERASLRRLIYLIHCRPQEAKDEVRNLFREFGVHSEGPPGPDDDQKLEFLMKSFDVVEGSNGVDLSENFQKTSSFSLSPWVLSWQKATNAFVLSLQELKTHSPEDLNLREMIMEIFQELPAN
eukprot:TRINITY_DN1060_c0_g1_i1.p1 TRINITY_DN1060_c0_g1~~TRINITY_DN1060_c0_g1_i1.p1  ORF type:complete len:498 (-),score=118.96 TRINITY_DN1060_c0_g1_i1:447-1940(-)